MDGDGIELETAAEFVFELLVCRWAELEWGDDVVPVVARQLGTADRRWDTVVVEADPDALADRAALGSRTLDSDLLHVVRNAPETWAWYRDALPDPGYPWRYVRAAVHRADARGVVETRRRGNRIECRRVAPYPDWVERVVAIENKPDLDRSAARRLGDQLRHDVDRALADEVWVATAATDDAIPPALLKDLPVEAGVLAVDRDGRGRARASVEWYPATLDPDPADERKRLEIAERAYGDGFRKYADAMRPDCRHFELRRAGEALVPWCVAKGRHQTPAECAGDCEEFEPEPPQWRTGGPPVEGGPGKAYRRLLGRRRERHRDGGQN